MNNGYWRENVARATQNAKVKTKVVLLLKIKVAERQTLAFLDIWFQLTITSGPVATTYFLLCNTDY